MKVSFAESLFLHPKPHQHQEVSILAYRFCSANSRHCEVDEDQREREILFSGNFDFRIAKGGMTILKMLSKIQTLLVCHSGDTWPNNLQLIPDFISVHHLSIS